MELFDKNGCLTDEGLQALQAGGLDELGRLELPELLELPKELLPPLPAELPELDLLEKLLDELEWLELLRPPLELLPDAPPLANLLPPPPLFLYKSYHQNLYLSPKT